MLCLGTQLPKIIGHALEFGAEVAGIGLETGEHARIHQLSAVALHRSSTLDQHGGDAPGPFTKLLDANHLIRQIEVAARRQLGLGRHDAGVERGELGSQFLLGGMQRDLLAGESGEPSALRGDLATALIDLQRAQLGHEITMPTRCFGLSFEGAQLTAHLAQQVLHAQQAGLGGVEATLGALLATAELQHTGCFLDDRSPLFGPRVQHRVDLTLTDDHVLLAAHTRIAQQFLHVEQTARDTVDRVLALARAEQDARHRDLGELDRQEPSGVVDREAHFSATERRALGRAGEDHVVHLLASHRAGRLGAEDPGDGIDHIRLARPVGPDDHGDPRLELEGGGVGERLESFEGQRLQEHGARDHSRARAAPRRTHPLSAAGTPQLNCHRCPIWAPRCACTWLTA